MKSLKDALLESCEFEVKPDNSISFIDPDETIVDIEDVDPVEDDDVEVDIDDDGVEVDIDEGEVKSEKDFRQYAENKFKEVFGDKLDKERMEFTINGILKNYKDAADEGNWGELVGILNKSFGS